MKDAALTQDDLADALGVTRYSVNQLVNDRRGVTAEMALRLSRATHTTPEFWLDLQRQIDLERAAKKLGSSLSRVRRIRKTLSAEQLFYEADQE